MNERIRELAKQSDKIVKSQHPNADMNTGVVIMMDVFAELIVREMCQVMKAEVEEFDLDQNFGAVQGVGRCIKVVKQHFGVES